jgi:hypothetical protein
MLQISEPSACPLAQADGSGWAITHDHTDHVAASKTVDLRSAIPTSVPRTRRTEEHGPTSARGNTLLSGIRQHDGRPPGRRVVIYTIFEVTSEIQRLVISRAISGLRVE